MALSAIRAGAAYVELFLKDNALTRGLKNAATKLQTWGAALSGVGTKMGAIGAKFSDMGTQFIATGLKIGVPLALAVRSFSNAGTQLFDMAKRTGFAVETLSELKYAAEQVGASLEDVENGSRKLGMAIAQAVNGSQEAKDAFTALGLQAEQLAKMNAEDRFRAVGDSLARIADPATRSAVTLKILGESAGRLVPLFEGGTAGIRRLNTAIGEAQRGSGGARSAFAELGLNAQELAKVPLDQRFAIISDRLSKVADEGKRAALQTQLFAEEGQDLAAFSRFLAGVRSGAAGTADALGRLGLSSGQLAGKSAADQMQVIRDRLAKIPSDADRATLAVQVFGNAARDGLSAVDQLRGSARFMGLTLTGEDAAKAKQFGDTLTDLSFSAKRAVFEVGSALAPMLKIAAEHLKTASRWVGEFIRKNQALVPVLALVAGSFLFDGVRLKLVAAAMGILSGVVTGLSIGLRVLAVGMTITAGIATAIRIGFLATAAAITLVTAATIGLGSASTAMETLKAAVSAVLNPIKLIQTALLAAAVGFVVYVGYSSGAASKTYDAFAGAFKDIKNVAIDAWGGISEAIAKGDLAAAGRLAFAGLKVAWLRIVVALKESWYAWKEGFVKTFYEAVGSIVKGWHNVVAFFKSIWTMWINGVRLGWSDMAHDFEKVWSKIQMKLAGKSEVEIETKQQEIEQRKQKARQNILQPANNDLIEQERELQRQQRRIDEALEAMRKERTDENQKEIDKAMAEYNKALAEFQRARKEIKDLKPLTPNAPPPPRPELPNLDDIISQRQKVDVVGTFNTAALSGMGASSLAERQFRVIDSQRKDIAKIREAVGSFAPQVRG